MSTSKVIMAIDQGTTGTTVLLFDESGKMVAKAYSEFRQYYPKPGWVEHDAEEIWQVTLKVIHGAVDRAGITLQDIAAIGISNQRETTVLWDRKTGVPIAPAIVWQCRRTSEMCRRLKDDGLESTFTKKTGLVIDAYFSATKIKWLLDHIPEARTRAENGEVLFGTIDSWLLWKLTGGVHSTDYTNASRTLIYNIHEQHWDDELLDILDIPRVMLPSVQPSSAVFGHTNIPQFAERSIPITGIAGDQQAALYGQLCWEPGMVKNTYGTGCFMVLNTGDQAIDSKHKLLTTLACNAAGKPCYALEGAVFIAGAVIQWLRDELGLIETAAESEELAFSVEDTHGVYMVPAFVGLGAPHWDMEARGTIVGLTRGANRAHMVRAALESIAFQSYDVLEAMVDDADIDIKTVRVDGGAVANDFLMQFQADLLNIEIDRPQMIETTALGAAMLAGLAAEFWRLDELREVRKTDAIFIPALESDKRGELISAWHKAVRQCRM